MKLATRRGKFPGPHLGQAHRNGSKSAGIDALARTGLALVIGGLVADIVGEGLKDLAEREEDQHGRDQDQA